MAAAPWTDAPRPPASYARDASRKPNPAKVGLLNLLLPGLGTTHAGHPGEGGLQFLLFLVGVFTAPFLFGLALLAGTWAWSQVSTVLALARPRREPDAPA